MAYIYNQRRLTFFSLAYQNV